MYNFIINLYLLISCAVLKAQKNTYLYSLFCLIYLHYLYIMGLSFNRNLYLPVSILR